MEVRIEGATVEAAVVLAWRRIVGRVTEVKLVVRYRSPTSGRSWIVLRILKVISRETVAVYARPV